MLESVQAFLENVATNVRGADVIDIMLVAGFLYLIFLWIRQSTERGTTARLAVVLLIFTVLYVPARAFDMHLIGRMAEVFFVAFVLAVVVIFQSDLRRMLDRAGTWLFSGGGVSSAEAPIDQLTEAVAHMAREHTGALIAIRGNEPWEQHIQGGVMLDGRLSLPLLYSIFEHTTPGHDGALLMEGDRIVKFAAHLPLPDSVPAVSEYGGTRHSAALGLAERCDAFIIVVSEERGIISVAEQGKIEEIESSQELKARIDRFWEETYAEQSKGTRVWPGSHSIQAAAVALAVAVMLWFVFAYSPGTTQRSYEVPIQYRNVPENWILQDGEQWADVTLSGPEQGFRLLDEERLAIVLDMENPEEGWNEFTLDRGNMDLPDQLTVEVVQPQTPRVRARAMRSVVLRVAVPTEGALPDTLRLLSLETQPATASVLVPRDSPGLVEIRTEPIDLSQIAADTTIERRLVLTPDMRFLPDAETEVEIHVNVERVTQ